MRTTTAQLRHLILVLLAWAGSCLFASGITRGQQATPTQGAPEKQSAAPGPANNVRPAMKWKRFDYTCEAGAKITVYLHNTTAKVRTGDQMYMMRQTRPADGNRYSDGKVLWWGKGDTGFLQEDMPDGDGKMLVKGCVLDKPLDAAKP
jgi:membrane-bound inhibitor of C-type lysozyme